MSLAGKQFLIWRLAARLALTLCVVAAGLGCDTFWAAEPPALVWDALLKEASAKSGVTELQFVFHYTNVSPKEIIVHRTSSSCGCTALNVPEESWRIPPKSSGKIEADVDISNKYGELTKSISLDTSAGQHTLLMRMRLPNFDNATLQRDRNQQLAKTDRQVVFRGDCARCHAEPAKGKKGRELFQAACAICHEAPHRATMVPDLRRLNKPTDDNYWRMWTTVGKEGSLMPAFAKQHGGPLDEQQIDSLIKHLSTKPSTQPAGSK
jgi:cytochrome c553